MEEKKTNESTKEGTGSKESPAPEGGGSFWHIFAGLALSVLILGAVFYLYRVHTFEDTYFYHTVINGYEAQNKTAAEMKEVLGADVAEYALTVTARGGEAYTYTAGQLGLYTAFDGSLEEIIHQQNPYAWPRYLLKGPEYDLSWPVAVDEALFHECVAFMPFLDEEAMEAPKDAHLSDYIPGEGYVIVSEEEGTTLDAAAAADLIYGAVLSMQTSLDLSASGLYEEPKITSDDASLIRERNAKNYYVNTVITYTFGEKREVLDGSLIKDWLIEADGRVTLNEAMVEKYVRGLAKLYNTAYTTRPFMTSYGEEVEVTGFYGWLIDEEEEIASLTDLLESGTSAVKEPAYTQEGASHDGYDYGDTYAEVNLSAQHMFFYEDGELILESDFVSGLASVASRVTPEGIFGITYKTQNAVLKGQGYASPVKFWMPFNRGIGFHDASWRNTFGGTIYKTNGSHGCINLPYAVAKTLYEHVYINMPVICYNLEGTESAKTTRASGSAPVSASAAQTAAAAQAAQAAAAQAAAEAAAAEAAAQAAAAQAAAEAATAQATAVPAGPGETTPVQTQATVPYGPAFAN